VQWHTPVIPALRRLRPEDCEFKVSTTYISRPYIQKEKGNKDQMCIDKDKEETQKKNHDILALRDTG
jgi:hypothetical protein